MTTTSMQGDRRPDRVRHSWRCVRRGPLVEVVRTDPTGRARVVSMCQECGHDDLPERILAERQEHTP
jgi:ribosomal protein L44E